MVVVLLDGPCMGTTQYEIPLPNILVVPEPVPHCHPTTGWHDYAKIGETSRYRHSLGCKCHASP